MRNKTLILITLCLLIAGFASGQAALSSTTLSAAVADVDTATILLTSTTGISTGMYLYVDRELIRVNSVPTAGKVLGQRGVSPHDAGGPPSSQSHLSGATVYWGTQEAFTQYDRAGSCTATNETILPIINVMNGRFWNCIGSLWVMSSASMLHTIRGTGVLTTGTPSTLAITGMSPPFTSSSTYTCTAQDTTTVANNIGILAAGYVSGSAVTFTGPNTNTDGVRWTCTGY